MSAVYFVTWLTLVLMTYRSMYPKSEFWKYVIYVTNWSFMAQTLNACVRAGVVLESYIHEKRKGELFLQRCLL